MALLGWPAPVTPFPSPIPFVLCYWFLAKLPHREGHSVYHMKGRGERTPVIGLSCTDLG